MKLTKLTILISILFLFFTISSDVSAATIVRSPNNTGLVGYWNFDVESGGSTVYDLSGQGNHGAMTNMDPATDWVDGKVGSGAMDFDGSDDHVLVGNPSVLQISSDISMCAWVYQKTASKFILAKSDGSTRDYGMYTNGASYLTLFAGGSNFNSSPNAVPLNKWSHVCITVANTQITFYIDNQATVGSTVTISNNNKTLAVGQDGSSPGFRWNGLIDDVRIYNRALSASEVKRLYNSSAGTKIGVSNSSGTLSDGLVGHWTFDGKDMTSNVADISGQGNTGYLQGQTSTTTALGVLGQALDFDGVDDYVLINSAIIGNNDISACAWIYLKSSPPNRFNAILNNTKFYFEVDTFSGNNSIKFSNDSTATIGSSAFSANVWTFVCVTRLGSGGATVNLYINGGLSGDANRTAGTPTATAFPTVIGQLSSLGGDNFYGLIDEVRIYNRALSAEEIKRLYNMTSTKFNTANSAGTLSDGLVGHWTFDGKDMTSNVADISGQGNTGYLQGQTSTTTALGVLGQAMEFDGSDDYVIVSDDTSLQVGAGSFTYTLWFKHNGTVNTTSDFIGTESFVANTQGTRFYITDSNKRVSFYINDGTSAYFAGALAGHEVSANTWTHLVGVVNRDDDTIRVYVNGVDPNTSPNSISGAGSSETNYGLGIGWTDNTTRTTDGLIDDVRVYNRALSADEISRLYDMGR